MGSPFLTAVWRQLAMVNYEVPEEVLRPYVPRGTELDTFEGKTLASVVGFLFEDTRVKGWRIPGHVNFEEVNLRFYVRRVHEGTVRRGVVFIKEIVPRVAIAWVARGLYNEPYVALPMRHEVEPDRRVKYGWFSGGRWHELGLTVEDEPRLPERGSIEEFITEHYWGYTKQVDGGTKEYEVRHPQWGVSRAARVRLDADIATLYGQQFASYLYGEPHSALLARGSEVSVLSGVRLA